MALVGLAAGLVLAVAFGALLVAFKVVNVSRAAEPARVSSAPITLPANLAGLDDLVAASKARMTGSASTRSSALVSSQQANQDKVNALTVASYQRAFPGAAVAYRAYADSELLHFVSVVAVRATSNGLANGPVTDPAYLGLAVPQQQIKTFGDVDCLVVQLQLTEKGSPVDPANDGTTLCQRTGPALTVQIYGGSFHGPADQQRMVALTSAAYDAISG